MPFFCMELGEAGIAMWGGFVIGQKNGYRVGSHLVRYGNALCFRDDYGCCLFSLSFFFVFFRIWFYYSVKLNNKFKCCVWWDRASAARAVG